MTQTIKLGLPGLETTLFGESRSFVTSGNQLNSIDSQSAGGTIDVNFIANKRTFTINYGVLSEEKKWPSEIGLTCATGRPYRNTWTGRNKQRIHDNE